MLNKHIVTGSVVLLTLTGHLVCVCVCDSVWPFFTFLNFLGGSLRGMITVSFSVCILSHQSLSACQCPSVWLIQSLFRAWSDTRPWLTHWKILSHHTLPSELPIHMRYWVSSSLKLSTTHFLACLFPSLYSSDHLFTSFQLSMLHLRPASVLHHWLNLPLLSFSSSAFFSRSISTFQAFQLSTLHQRPDSVLQRLTKAQGSTTSRHGKNSLCNLITDSEGGLHTYRVQTCRWLW